MIKMKLYSQDIRGLIKVRKEALVCESNIRYEKIKQIEIRISQLTGTERDEEYKETLQEDLKKLVSKNKYIEQTLEQLSLYDKFELPTQELTISDLQYCNLIKGTNSK